MEESGHEKKERMAVPKFLHADPEDGGSLVPHLNRLPPLQHMQRLGQRVGRVSLRVDKFPDEGRVRRAPTDGQTSPEFRLDLVDLVHEFLPRRGSLPDGLHGRGPEESDGLVHMDLGRHRAERHFGQRLRDADNGLELADRDRNAGTLVAVLLDLLHLLPNGHKVTREFLRRLDRQSRGTVSKIS